MIIGVRKRIKIEPTEKDIKGIIESRMTMDNERWTMVSVYNRMDEEGMLLRLEERIEEAKGKNIMVAGDFNARIAGKGDISWEEGNWKRQSKDKTINKQGEKLLEMIEKMGVIILNGNKDGARTLDL